MTAQKPGRRKPAEPGRKPGVQRYIVTRTVAANYAGKPVTWMAGTVVLAIPDSELFAAIGAGNLGLAQEQDSVNRHAGVSN